jgi:protein SCO1/2
VWSRSSSFVVLASLATLLPPLEARAAIDTEAALARSQAALGTVPENRTLLDVTGKPVNLTDFRGRPVLLSLVYTSCPHVCPTITKNLKRVTDEAAATLGSDAFYVLTVGFDSVHDTPPRMASYARARGIDDTNWRFLAADAQTVEALAEDVGFTYFATAGGFDHMTQVTLLDSDGRVFRQVYGADMEIPALVEPLRKLTLGERFSAGSFSDLVEGVRLVCTVYDPATGRYRFDYAIVMTVLTGILCLGVGGFFVVRLWRTA